MLATRRKFLTRAAGFLAAPAIVRAASLMPVRALAPAYPMIIGVDLAIGRKTWFVSVALNDGWLRNIAITEDELLGKAT